MHSHEEYDIKMLAALQTLADATNEKRDPIHTPILMSTVRPWNIDYKNRNHLYIWSPIAITVTLEDYGSLAIPATTWHNFEFPEGMRIFSNQTSDTYAYIKATDEPLVYDYLQTLNATITSPTVTPGDGVANPSTAVTSASFLEGYNGTTWDRLRSFQQVLNVANDMYTYTHITTNTTTVIKSGAGAMHTISINNPGSAWVLTVFDNTAASGTQIAVLAPVTGLVISMDYDVRFTTGLTILSAGTTAGDITVSSR